MNHNNILIIIVPEGEEREQGEKNLLEEKNDHKLP